MTSAATVAPIAGALTDQRTSVAGYQKIEAGIADLRDRFSGAVFDVRTAKGLADARAARGELRDTRMRLEDARKSEKAEALAYGRLLDAEAKRIEGAIRELEDPIAVQVQAEDARREDERKARAQAEAEQQAAIARRIDWFRLCVADMVGKTAAEIHTFASELGALELGADAYGDRLEEAGKAKVDALARLGSMQVAAACAEAERHRLAEESRKLEAQRATQQREDDDRRARIAKEDAERAAAQKAEDDARNAARKAEDDERARLRKIDEDREAAVKAERERVEAAARQQREREAEAAAETRRKQREILEGLANPWAALARISSIADVAVPGTAMDAVTLIARIAGETTAARAALDGPSE